MTSNATAERLKHVQELRKAHFYFGFDAQTNYQSAAKCQIPAIKNTKIRPNTSIPDQTAPAELQLQKNHFHLGDEKPKLESIQKSDFQRPLTAVQAKLSDETKKDLRTHHFQLGFHDFTKPTEYKTKFQGSSSNNQGKCDNENIRKHHHEFGDTKNYYSSMYDTMHNKQYDKAFLGQGYSKDKMQDMNVELRKTNLSMGQDRPQYNTQSHSIHNDRLQGQQSKQDENLKQLVRNTHIQMGTDRIEYQSHNKEIHSGAQPKESAKLNQAQLKDLRATHFNVGNDKVNYDSHYKQQFGNDNALGAQKVLNPSFQVNNFTIADNAVRQDVQEHYKSSYNAQFSGQKSDAVQPIQDKSKNIYIGNDQLSYASEAWARFKDPRSQPGKLDEKLQKDLRSHHFQFGSDNDKLQSQNKATYIGQSGKASKLDEGMKKDLRQHHFQLGFQNFEYQPHSKEIGSKQGPPNKLPPEVAQRIRQSAQLQQ